MTLESTTPRRVATSSGSPRRASRPSPRPGQQPSTSLTVVMGLVLIYFFLPLVWLLINATKTQGDLFSSPGLWFGHDFALLDNLRRLFSFRDAVFGHWLLNTVIYAVVMALGSAVISAIGGYGMARFTFPGKRPLFVVVLGASLIPGSVLAVPIFLVASAVGLADSPLAFIIPGLASPFGLYLMWVYCDRAVPTELIEAARVDGASELRIFVSIVLRLLGPGLTSLTLFQLTGAWNNYFLPLIVLTSPEKLPLAVGLAQLNGQATQANADASASALYPLVITGCLVAVIPLIAAFLFLQRYWQSGLATGGVKA